MVNTFFLYSRMKHKLTVKEDIQLLLRFANKVNHKILEFILSMAFFRRFAKSILGYDFFSLNQWNKKFISQFLKIYSVGRLL